MIGVGCALVFEEQEGEGGGEVIRSNQAEMSGIEVEERFFISAAVFHYYCETKEHKQCCNPSQCDCRLPETPAGDQ